MGGLNFGERNSCCKVLWGLVTTVIPLLQSSLKSGSFRNKKKNITGMPKTVPKDLTSQTMLGRTIILLTLRMQLLLIKATIACVKLLNHGILPRQLTLKITPNCDLDNI